ncbi:MAG: 4Fe-4S dicluster domain-containing protein [Armatimonadetes bacterium]|nr:4Fe-4S dicluster domain-containing protein [Armatimonadota bacterium]
MSKLQVASKPPPKMDRNGPSRREIIVQTFFSLAATASLTGCLADKRIRDDFVQKYFKDLSPEELKTTLARMEKQYWEDYGKHINVTSTPPLEGVLYGYALDLSRCIGCRKCVYACVDENNQSRDPQTHWITVLEMDKEGGVDLAKADAFYDHEEVPAPGKFYMPVACQHCENPPCVKVCPVGATWKEPDGIVVIDYNWCIGCRCCITACPYGARRFNWTTPTIPKDQINTETDYLGNRPRPRGVVEKCTWCIGRVRKGLYPRCVEACPVGARKFGNLLDPESEVRYIIENKRVLILKEELNTQPKFFYYYGL